MDFKFSITIFYFNFTFLKVCFTKSKGKIGSSFKRKLRGRNMEPEYENRANLVLQEVLKLLLLSFKIYQIFFYF